MYWTRNYRICAIAALGVVLTLTPVTLSIPAIPMPSSGENTINKFQYNIIISVLCVINACSDMSTLCSVLHMYLQSL